MLSKPIIDTSIDKSILFSDDEQAARQKISEKMAELDGRFPSYGFATHKGYSTPEHQAALEAHGPCPEHRFSYVNVARRVPGDPRVPSRTLVRVEDGSVQEEVLVG